MKRMKQLLSFALVVVISISLIGCGGKKEENKSTTSNNESKESAKELLTTAAKNMEKQKDFESMTAKIEFAINYKEAKDSKDKDTKNQAESILGDLCDVAASGTVDISAFVKDFKVKAACNMQYNGEKSKYEGYLTDKAATFTLDGKKYQTLTFSTLSSLGIDFNSAVDETKKKASGEATASPEEEKYVKDAEELFKKWADSFKVEGTTQVNGQDAKIVKGILDKKMIEECMKLVSELSKGAKDSLGSLGSLATGNTESLDIPEDFKGIDFEVYVSSKDNTVVGMNIDFSDFVKTETKAEKAEKNYIKITWGCNNAEKFDIPEGEEVDLTGLLSLLTGKDSVNKTK